MQYLRVVDSIPEPVAEEGTAVVDNIAVEVGHTAVEL